VCSLVISLSHCLGLFACFDSNADGHVDLPEFVMSVSKCCRKSQEERLKCELCCDDSKTIKGDDLYM